MTTIPSAVVVENSSDLQDFGRNEWRIGIVESGLSGRDASDSVNRVVVYFHGGPRAPFVDQKRLSDLDGIFDDGRTVIASVAYSATELQNFDGSTRLRKHQFGAIECDSLAVANYIKDMEFRAKRDLNVLVIGESLGSVPALRLFSELSNEVDGLILTSPWIFPLPVEALLAKNVTYVSNAQVVSPKDREALRGDATRLYKDYFAISDSMSGTLSGDRYLQEIRRKACHGLADKALVFIPQHEDRADVAATTEYFHKCAGSNSVFPVQSAFHGMEYSFSWVRSLIMEF